MLCRKQKNLFANALSKQLQAGQILLIAILVIIVALTIGLSLASRSIISLKSSTEEVESQKALAAAEAGIERAIQGNVITPGPAILSGNLTANNSRYSVDVQSGNAKDILINGGNMIPKDEGADVWVVSHNNSNIPAYSEAKALSGLNMCWGSASEICGSSTAPAAIEVIVITRNPLSPNEVKSYRYTYDPCPLRGNNFTSANPGSCIVGKAFAYKTPSNHLAFGISNIVFMRVIPIYKNAVIGVHSDTTLPAQGYLISSTGTSGQANRKITVFKGYPQTYLPYLSYGLFVAN